MGSDLHRPDGTTAIAAAVVVHPHPAMGGDRHHPLIVAIAEGLAQSGVVALRPDLTDADTARSASRLEALASELVDQVGQDLVLVGYSWGSIVAAMAAPPRLVGSHGSFAPGADRARDGTTSRSIWGTSG
jgi:alpha/beta superfamily hydrolase